MLEIDERARRVEEMTESPPDERHVMSVIMGILDSETLKHTIHFQGMKKSVSDLKRKVMEFVNLTIPSKSDPIYLGRVETRREDTWEKVDDDEWDDDTGEYDDGNLCGFGETCHNCGGHGHYWALLKGVPRERKEQRQG